jgi:hypothetical protein
MSSAKVALAKAQADVKAAEGAVAVEERETAKQALRAARVGGRAAKTEFDRAERIFYRAQTAFDLLQSKLDGKNVEIDQHERAQPQNIDFPSDAEIEAWTRGLHALVAERDALRKEAREADFAKEQARLAGIAAGKRVEAAQYAMRNLENKMRDPENHGLNFAGGVSKVF